MRNPQGYARLFDPDPKGEQPRTGHQGVASLQQCGEADTFTCNHCQAIVHVAPRCDPADLGGLCKQCMKLVCPQCHASGRCVPWEKQMEQAEARAAARRSYGF